MVSTCYLRFRHPPRGSTGPTGGWPFPPASHVDPMADAAGDVATDAEAAAVGVVAAAGVGEPLSLLTGPSVSAILGEA